MSRTVSIINWLLGIVIIAILAFIVANSLSQRLGTLPFAQGGGSVPAVPSAPAKTEDLSFYAPILTNGLFGTATQGQLLPIAGPTAGTAATPATAPNELLLLGTVVGSFRETFALVRHTAKQEERVYRLGDMVFDAGRLVQVTREQAFISVGGRKVELLTPMMPPAGPVAQGTQPTTQTGVAVASTGAGSYVIDQRALNAALDNIGQAMTDARLLPSQKDGRVEGFRVSEVKPAGVFAMIGLRNGDVLMRLNDFPIDSPDKALQSFISLKGQNRLKLDVIRDGHPTTFNYDIR